MSGQLYSKKNSSFLSSRGTIPSKVAKKSLVEISVRILSKGPQRDGIGRDHRGKRTSCLYRDQDGLLGLVHIFPEEYQQKVSIEKGYNICVDNGHFDVDVMPDSFNHMATLTTVSVGLL